MRECQIYEYTVDNRDVVPYNPRALLRFGSHVNVEIIIDFKVMKYMFKYFLKGPDRVLYGLKSADNTTEAAAEGQAEGKQKNKTKMIRSKLMNVRK